MKLLRQTKLASQEKTSDKIYEVDLCEQGNNQYLVNFRYGRRGAVLKEGTKTTSPVSLKEAEVIFDKLVKSKLDRGYYDLAQPGAAAAISSLMPSNENKARSAAIIKHLDDAVNNQLKAQSNWKLSRVIWRAGEMQLKEAVPYILVLAPAGDDMQLYCSFWTLGRCGDESALPLLKQFYKDKNFPLANRMARFALLEIAQNKEREDLVKEFVAELPASLRTSISNPSDYSAFKTKLEAIIESSKDFSFLLTLYLLADDYKSARKALAEILPKIKIRTGVFRAFRHIFKAAEFRQDGQFFGLTGYAFEKKSALYNKSRWSSNVWIKGQRVNAKQELAKENSRLAYGNDTREYLKRRVLRTLKRSGELKDTNYVKMALGVLLAYNEQKDRAHKYSTSQWRWNAQTSRYITTYQHFDTYSRYLTFYYILYANSTRYGLKKGATAWHCKGDYKPGDAAPQNREEAFPELWDQVPMSYMHLLAESNTSRVDDFAIKGLKRHDDLLKKVDARFIAKLLKKPFANTVKFGVELAKTHFDANTPDFDLIKVLLKSNVPEARQLACEWMSSNKKAFLRDTGLVTDLISSTFEDIRLWAKNNLPSSNFNDQEAETIIVRSFANLMALKKDDQNPIAKDAGETLILTFSDKLQKISLTAVRDLLAHPLQEVQAFGAKILLKHETKAEALPDDVFETLINSGHAETRSLGVELFGQLPDEVLLQRKDVVSSFCISKQADIRKSVRPIVKRLVAKEASYGKELVSIFIPVLLTKEKYEGLHEDISHLLRNELDAYLGEVDQSISLRLLNSKHKPAQEMGIALLKKNIAANDLSMRQIIAIADHEILEARTIAWKMYEDNMGRVRYEKEEALRILDANWDDSRSFAFNFFRDNFKDSDWTPELLIGICDSVRPDVQAFGRELITRFFKEENGLEYLLKLSQHPRVELQIFATNYLSRFASGNINHIRRLGHYFNTVLSQINKGRVAKDRVFDFLHEEAQKDKAVAEIVAKIMSRISATVAIRDKARCIEIMRDLNQKYPELAMPLSTIDFPTIQ